VNEKMPSLMDLPIEVFCSYIFPRLPKDEILWNVAFVCETLQLYSLSYIRWFTIVGCSGTKETYHKLLHSTSIANSITHIVNRNDIEYELVEELKLTIGSTQLLLEIKNSNIPPNSKPSPASLIEVCKKCLNVETLISIGANILPIQLASAVTYLKNIKCLILFCKESCLSLTDTNVMDIVSQCFYLDVIVLMDHISITDKAIFSLSENCKNLRNINVHGCDNITDRAIDALTANCKHIRSLDLYGCDKLTDASLKSIAFNSMKIEEIDIGKCSAITDEGVKILSLNCTELLSFDGSSCYKLSDDSVIYLATNCIKLEFLALEFCEKLTNQCIQYISDCKHLKHLDLNGCYKITDEWTDIANNNVNQWDLMRQYVIYGINPLG
jgi:hypothetical protein